MKVELPNRAPIMVLPNATLFPHALLPLYIFEERYREMVEDVLASHRMFCIALNKPEVDDALTDVDFYHVGAIGLIRAAVENEDGTKHIILQGVSRVRFADFHYAHSYIEAKLQLLQTENRFEVSSDTLRLQVIELMQQLGEEGCNIPPQLTMLLEKEANGEMLIDQIAFNYLEDPHARQEILEETEITSRLTLCRRHLFSQLGLKP